MKRNAQTVARSINWTEFGRRVSTLSKSLRRLFQVTLAPAIILLAIVVFTDIREKRAFHADLRGWSMRVMMVVSFFVLCRGLRRVYLQRQSEAIAAQATPEGLISFCRREVERQLKHYRAFLWMFSLFILYWLFIVFLVGNVDGDPPAIFLLLSGAPPTGVLIGAIWAFRATIRLGREREELS
jgi:hypothetical protein